MATATGDIVYDFSGLADVSPYEHPDLTLIGTNTASIVSGVLAPTVGGADAVYRYTGAGTPGDVITAEMEVSYSSNGGSDATTGLAIIDGNYNGYRVAVVGADWYTRQVTGGEQTATTSSDVVSFDAGDRVGLRYTISTGDLELLKNDVVLHTFNDTTYSTDLSPAFLVGGGNLAKGILSFGAAGYEGVAETDNTASLLFETGGEYESTTLTLDYAGATVFPVTPVIGDAILHPSTVIVLDDGAATADSGTYLLGLYSQSTGRVYSENLVLGQSFVELPFEVGAGHNSVVLAAGFDDYVTRDLIPEPVAGDQLSMLDADGYFTEDGHLYVVTEGTLLIHIYQAATGMVTTTHVDSAGLVEYTGEVPAGSVTFGPVSKSDTTITQPFSYSANDALWYEYRVDGGVWVTATSPVELTGRNAGQEYEIQVRAVNEIGAGPTYIALVTTDETPTVPQGVIIFDSVTTTTSSVSAPFIYDDNDHDGFQQRIDGGPWGSTTSPVEVSGLNEDESVLIEVRAVNETGGGAVSSVTATTDVSVIAPEAPQGTVTFSSPTVTEDSISQPYVYDSDDETGFQRRINGGSWSSTNNPVSITDLSPEQSVKIDVRAVNDAGNGNTVTTTVTTLGSSATVPQGVISFGVVDVSWDSATVSFAYDLDDATGYEYRLGNGTWQPAVSPLALIELEVATSAVLSVRAVNVDGAGPEAQLTVTTTEVPDGIVRVDTDDVIHPGQTFDIIIGMPSLNAGQAIRSYIVYSDTLYNLTFHGRDAHRLTVTAPDNLPLFEIGTGDIHVDVLNVV